MHLISEQMQLIQLQTWLLYLKLATVCTVQFRLTWTQASGTMLSDNIGIKITLPFGGNTTQA